MLLTNDDAARLASEGYFETDGYLQLRTQDAEGSPCFFLRDGLCSVYESRPEGCRLYPAVTDGEKVFLDNEHCPHTTEFKLPRATQDAVLRLGTKLEAERAERQS